MAGHSGLKGGGYGHGLIGWFVGRKVQGVGGALAGQQRAHEEKGPNQRDSASTNQARPACTYHEAINERDTCVGERQPDALPFGRYVEVQQLERLLRSLCGGHGAGDEAMMQCSE
jgi:hypothetical protein